jgi:4-amino-4-deoxy-L-arabinose transferase-like glycosyltransferase
LALGRAGILPFFWMASAVVFVWGYRCAGASAALCATLLFTSLPPVLAHAGLMTTDMAAAACTGAAVLASFLWIERPGWRRTVIFGAALGLACLSKFSALIFVPAALLLIHRGMLWHHRRPLAVACGVAFLVVWAGYRFSFARVDYLHLRLPAPRFFTGLATLWAHNAAGHASYLLGRRSATGFWYYYPVALAIKTPLAFLLLGAGAMAARVRRCAAPALLFCLAILLCSLASRINIGIRHILPVYIGLSVAGGNVAAALLRRRAARWMVAGLLLWHVASGVLQHPDYLAYTNEIAAGHPEDFLADSDLDWGQDMKRLAARLRRAGATEVTFDPFNRTYPSYAGDPFPRMLPADPLHPASGWNAVSVSTWKIFGVPSWPDGMAKQERVGRSIFLWYFAAAPGPQ